MVMRDCASDLIEERYDIARVDPAVFIEIKRGNRFVCHYPDHLMKEQDHVAEVLLPVGVCALIEACRTIKSKRL
jgi:hypothetical protein